METEVKKYRSRNNGIEYKTVSLTLEKKIMSWIESETQKTKEKNMSKFIEEITSPHLKLKNVPKRRKFGTYPVKKTFTFSIDFVDKINKFGNMSLYVEYILDGIIS